MNNDGLDLLSVHKTKDVSSNPDAIEPITVLEHSVEGEAKNSEYLGNACWSGLETSHKTSVRLLIKICLIFYWGWAYKFHTLETKKGTEQGSTR